MPDDSRTPAVDRRDFLKAAGLQTGLLFAGGYAPAIARTRGQGPNIIVVGAGAWGSWTALHLQRMGATVRLIDAYGPGNSRSTSGDETRGIRTGYADNVLWSTWASEAIRRWKQWDEIFQEAFGQKVFFPVGDLILRKEWEPFLEQTRATWDQVGIEYTVLTPEEVHYRWPVIDLTDIGVALYEHDAGVARARAATQATAELFRREGGTIIEERVHPGRRDNGRVQEVWLSNGETLTADLYVFACGPWLWKVFPEILTRKMRTSLGHVFYLGTPIGDDRFTWPHMPSYNFPGITGWPALPFDFRGFRVRTGGGQHSDPDYSDRWVPPESHVRFRNFLAERFPHLAAAPLLETRACHYESTSSGEFMITPHPDLSNLWIVGGGNAEGFKFGPVIGDYAARRIMGEEGDPELVARFGIPAEEYEQR